MEGLERRSSLFERNSLLFSVRGGFFFSLKGTHFEEKRIELIRA